MIYEIFESAILRKMSILSEVGFNPKTSPRVAKKCFAEMRQLNAKLEDIANALGRGKNETNVTSKEFSRPDNK